MICADTAEYAIGKLRRVARDHPHPESSVSDCQAFSLQVLFVEGVIRSTFGAAVQRARREPDPAKLIEMWDSFKVIVEHTMVALSDLKSQFPRCGTLELHDSMLDLRRVVTGKIDELKAEQTCPVSLPDALFP